MRILTKLLGCIVFIAILFVTTSFAPESNSEQEIKAVMRTIGHEVLKAHDDSTSRVLPVVIEGNTYVIQFDTEFVFQANKLVAAVTKVVEDNDFASEYLVEMQDCVSKEIIYSYQVSKAMDPDLIPCGVRAQPKACYNLHFTNTNRFQTAKVFAKLDNEGISTGIIWAMLGFVALGFVFYVYKKRPEQEIISHVISIGAYQFDPQKMLLSNADLSVPLTSKEADLLTMLYKSVNSTISRDEIFHQVWGNDSEYIGRTLDVFISKLRKKLNGDPNIKITNIRGVGYRLDVHGK